MSYTIKQGPAAFYGSTDDEAEKEDLRSKLELRGVTVDRRWGRQKLRDELDKLQPVDQLDTSVSTEAASEEEVVAVTDIDPYAWRQGMDDAPRDGTVYEAMAAGSDAVTTVRYYLTRQYRNLKWVRTGWWVDSTTGQKVLSELVAWRPLEGSML